MDKLYIVLLIAVLAVLAGGLLTLRVQQAAPGGEKLRWAGGALRRAAFPFAIRATIALGALGVLLFLFFAFIPGLSLRLAFSALIGVAASLFAAHVSLHAGVRGITNAAAAATRSPVVVVRKAMAAGAAGGFTAAGIALLALAALVMVLARGAEAAVLGEMLLQNLAGFVLGTCAVAIAFRCGGGIASQAAAMAKASVPNDIQLESDPAKNPAEICAIGCESISGLGGLAAEYCTVLSASLVAAMILGVVALKSSLGTAYPLLIVAGGLMASLLSMLWVFRSSAQKPLSAARAGQLVATVLMLLLALLITTLGHIPTGMFLAVLFGAAAGGIIALVDDYYAYLIAKPAGSATSQDGGWAFLDALWVGSRSSLLPVITLASAAVGAFAVCGGFNEPAKGMFGLSLAAVGAVAAGAHRIASLASACILKQAASIAPIAGLDEGNIATLNTLQESLPCACHVRGHSAGVFALAGLGLYAAFTHSANLPASDLNQPLVFGGLLMGATLVLWSAGGTMRATRLAAKSLITEVRRQFAEIPGLAEGQAEGNYERCSEIAAAHSIRGLGYASLALVVAAVLLGGVFRLLKVWLYAGTRSAGGGELAAGMIAGAVLLSLVIGLMAAELAGTISSLRKNAGDTPEGAFTASLGAAIASAASPMLLFAPILLASAALAFAGWLR